MVSEPARRFRRALLLLALASPAAGAQTLQLELRPRVGDTLRMRLDQVTEVLGSREGGRSINVSTVISLYSRAIVLSADGGGAVIAAIADSVFVQSNDAHARTLAERAREELEGRQIRLRLVPDGTVGLAGTAQGAARDVKGLIAAMPGSFPAHPIAVGDTWMREMPIPGSARMHLPEGGRARARFRLDSLSAGADLAYVSMRGSFEPAEASRRSDAEAGSVSGTLVINRRRGWLTESRFVVQVRSTVPAAEGSGRKPLRFRTRITQYMRVLEERRP